LERVARGVSSDPCRDTEAADKSTLGKEVESGEGGSLIGTTRNGLVAGGGSLSASHRSRRGRVIGRAVSVAGTERGDGAGMFYSNITESIQVTQSVRVLSHLW